MPFLSVIIPVYKVEPYLCQCVDSVLNQQIDDYELILVDDGSPDACPQICDEYAEKYQQVRVIHKPNGGLSSARNAGIDAANGQYTMFMDSDDWWNPDVSVEKMLAAVKIQPEIDVFLFSGFDYIEGEGLFERNDTIRRLAGKTYDAPDYYKAMLAIGNLQVSAATKIIKTEFMQSHDLHFQVGLKGEDNEWMLRLLRSKPAIMVIQEPLYIYRAGRRGSITDTIKAKNVEDLLCVVDSSIMYYSDQSVDRGLMKQEFCFCAYLWFCALGLSQKLNRDEISATIPRFKKTSVVCRYSKSMKTMIAYLTYKVLGFSATRTVLGLYIRVKNRLRLNKHMVIHVR